jgi:hypothetical protein
MPDPSGHLNVAVIGYGTVGRNQVKEMRDKCLDNILTVDIDPKKNADYTSIHDLVEAAPDIDVWSILVWTQDQIRSVIQDIAKHIHGHPLVSIESTIMPGTWAWAKSVLPDYVNVITFQERIYPNDHLHGIFNQARVMGGDYTAGRQFWLRYMIYENIIVTDDVFAAELSHIMDNTWRYLQIAAAEALATDIGLAHYSEVRRCVNSKWNLDMPEVRTGIGGHCLPKDHALAQDHFTTGTFHAWLDLAKLSDDRYRDYVGMTNELHG